MRPKTIKFILVFFNLVMLSSLGWSQCDGCNYLFTYSYNWYPDEIESDVITCQDTIISISDCNENDIQFINDLINQNEINEESTTFDTNDGDGVFEPNELGRQIWDNGRLVGLSIYDQENSSGGYNNFEYNVSNIPESISNLENIIYLDLDVNPIESLPSTFNSLQTLEYLWLGNSSVNNMNHMNQVPESIWELSNLKLLGIQGTDISEISDNLGNLTSLTDLFLGMNNLTVIPPIILNMTSLTSLYLGGNQIVGEIPSGINNLTNLTHLSLGSNQFIGEIPSGISNLTQMIWFSLDGNQLSGSIPLEILNLTNLTHLYLGGNLLSGSIPPEISNLTKLKILHLGYNQLSGLIPIEVWNLISLTDLKLFSNQFIGEFPSEIKNLENLNSLILSNNQLSGEIPTETWNLVNLEQLFLSDNQFSGQISTNISDLINLKRLKINNNQFSGEIPGTLCDIYSNLVFFDISNNNLCPSYPDCLINQELFDVDSDYNENGIWDEGEPFVDTNGNGIYEEDYVGEQDTTNCSTMSITDNLIPTTYDLSSPYPNPFNPTTTISFSIPQSDLVSLNVYDITGKLVTTLINEQLNIGYHSIDWDGTNQSSGMYLVRMESGEYVETQKLLLVK